MKFTRTCSFLFFALFFAHISAPAQTSAPLDVANSYVRSHFDQWGLSASDVADMAVSSQYTDKKTGITHIYFNQQFKGIPIYNALLNVSITKEGRAVITGNRFANRIAEKVNTTIPVISAAQAVKKLATRLGLPPEQPRLTEQTGEQVFVFEKGHIASEDIKVQLVYQVKDDAIRLAWDVRLFPVGSSDTWNSRIDATTGKILDQTNWTVYCKVDSRSFVHTSDDCNGLENTFHQNNKNAAPESTAAGAMYNVWPIPVESPIHGDREIVTDPHDPDASPFGWHDTNGTDGPEYTITRGNNVHAYQDSLDMNASTGDEPDGGVDLHFDFPFDPDSEPNSYVDAAVVNLFYMNNIMHDFAYHYGFDEAAGNFQNTNYSGEGIGGDFVLAEAQDGSGDNNANFSTPPDGSNGRMQMFRWTINSSAFRVDAPASVSGDYIYGSPGNGWGPGSYISDVPVSGEVFIVDDGISNPYPTDGCEPIINGSELEGKVALIDRGGCQFGFKGVQVQEQGAIGVIICNFEENPIGMAPGDVGSQLNIPIVMLGNSDCQAIRQFAGNGLVVTFQIPVQSGPSQYDSDLDNGVIAHEYGHGISNRLTGGPNAAGCLSGQEQMGEGWSDFMSLITTVRPADNGATPRGIGNYVDGFPANGPGIRHFPYSTDMNINPLTYASLPGESIPHGVGAVWCTILWDMYWNLVDQYGFDEDLYTGTGGNNIAVQLVFEGMKLQPCNPGFVDGRNAILAADQLLYDGANQCLIWETFARRGVGLSASQGTSDAVGDETEAFDLPCECRDKISITKSVTDFINAGDDIEVTITVSNCKNDPVSGVEVKDIIPDGTAFVAGSANMAANVQGNTIVFDLGPMPFGDEQTITYKLSTDPDKWSQRLWIEEVADLSTEDLWNIGFFGDVPGDLWQVTDQFGGHTGDFAWYMPDLETESRTFIEQFHADSIFVSGNQPVLRFWHKYNTEPALDGGVVDIKPASSDVWTQVPDRMIRNGYDGIIAYGTFIVPNLSAFFGYSGDEFIPTYIDLSDWAGKYIHLRFRFATDEQVGVEDGGWVIDDIELLDMLAYNEQACATTPEGDNVCAIAPEEGTIVETKESSTNATVEKLKDVTIIAFPNPVDNLLTIVLDSDRPQYLQLSLLTVQGRTLSSKTVRAIGKQYVQVDVSRFPAGFYFLRIDGKDGRAVQKVIIK